jgi:hypothetical protein
MILYYSNFNTLCNKDTDRRYLEKFINENFLVITDSSIGDLEKWDSKLVEIDQIVKNNNIALILLDLSHNPYPTLSKNLNTQPASKLLNDLLKICNTKLLIADFLYYYKPRPDCIFFPMSLWQFNTKQILWFSDIIFDTSYKKSKSMMCLNSIPAWQRLYFFELLIRNNTISNIDYSFIGNITADMLDNNIMLAENLSSNDLNLIKKHIHLLPLRLKNEPNGYFDSNGIGHPVYSDCAINIVTETSITDGVILTEKTCKPFMAYQIPILIASTGTNQFLEDIGLDMFSDYIPWKTWDNLEDHKLKMNMIADFVSQLLQNPTDILEKHNNFKSRIINNKEYFHSQKLLEILTKQFIV